MGDTEVSGDEDRDPRSLPPGVADERFAANVRDVRERLGLSQAEVARRMAERGWPYHPQTMQRIEAGHRKVSVGEAEALARILRTTMERLTWPGHIASAASLLDTFTGRAEEACEQIARWTSTLLFAQRQLATTVAEAESGGLHGSEQIRVLVGEAREAMTATPEEALSAGRADYQETLSAVASEPTSEAAG